jgi:hypothetical protein
MTLEDLIIRKELALNQSAQLRGQFKAMQTAHLKIMKSLQDNDDDLARLFKRLGIKISRKSN